MLSETEVLLLDGELKGVEYLVPCRVWATKVSLPRLEIWEYVRAEVADAPGGLPDGPYEVCFEGRRMKVRKVSGVWESGSQPS